MIIDGGSTDNLVSLEMVEKLSLEMFVHPTPYKVTWLHKGHHILVNEQCKIKFKIGNYQDEVLCDVITMDVCHVLLGRPWQYDQREIYDGRKNTYTFEKNGERHTLLPLKDEGATTKINNQVLMMSEKEFLKKEKEVKAEYTFLDQPKTIVADFEVIDLPLENQILLNEHEDVITSELSSEMLTRESINEAKEIIAEENFSEEIVMESNEDEVDERPDGSLKEILKISGQHRENMPVLEASREQRSLKFCKLIVCLSVWLQVLKKMEMEDTQNCHKRERGKIVS
jgi:hypothetical protein